MRWLIIALVTLGGIAHAQSSATTGAIDGVVVERATGSPALGATIVATSPALLGEQVVLTDENGTYRIDALPPGLYVLTIYYENVAQTRPNVLVQLGKTSRVNLRFDATRRHPNAAGAAGRFEERPRSCVAPEVRTFVSPSETAVDTRRFEAILNDVERAIPRLTLKTRSIRRLASPVGYEMPDGSAFPYELCLEASYSTPFIPMTAGLEWVHSLEPKTHIVVALSHDAKEPTLNGTVEVEAPGWQVHRYNERDETRYEIIVGAQRDGTKIETLHVVIAGPDAIARRLRDGIDRKRLQSVIGR